MRNNSRTDSKRRQPGILFICVYWLLVALWAMFIFFMSSNTGSGLNEGLGFFSQIFRSLKDIQVQLLGMGIDVLSSIAHFCEYMVLGGLLANALRCHMPLRRAILVSIMCTSFYGVTDEIHQLFVPGRMSDPVDWLVDTLGGIVGSFIGYACLIKRNKD